MKKRHSRFGGPEMEHREDQLKKFNSETLIDMLARVGVRVEVRPVSRDRYRRFNLPSRSR